VEGLKREGLVVLDGTTHRQLMLLHLVHYVRGSHLVHDIPSFAQTPTV
jgi:hypothetical protein